LIFLKPSRRASGHGFLPRRGRKSEPERGSGDFLAGEIDRGFENINQPQNILKNNEKLNQNTDYLTNSEAGRNLYPADGRTVVVKGRVGRS